MCVIGGASNYLFKLFYCFLFLLKPMQQIIKKISLELFQMIVSSIYIVYNTHLNYIMIMINAKILKIYILCNKNAIKKNI